MKPSITITLSARGDLIAVLRGHSIPVRDLSTIQRILEHMYEDSTIGTEGDPTAEQALHWSHKIGEFPRSCAFCRAETQGTPHKRSKRSWREVANGVLARSVPVKKFDERGKRTLTLEDLGEL